MDEKEYGDNYKSHLLEQYKVYVEMADRISQRRDQSNRFYGSLLTGIVAMIAVVDRIANLQSNTGFSGFILISVAVAGIVLCAVWFINIRSYKQLNSAKFKIIHEIEELLPFPLYKKEWKYLRPLNDKHKYFQLTRVEQLVPLIFLIPYIILIIYALVS